MDVSENSGTPKSSILIGVSVINHPFLGTPIFGNTHIQACFLPTMNDLLFFFCGKAKKYVELKIFRDKNTDVRIFVVAYKKQNSQLMFLVPQESRPFK